MDDPTGDGVIGCGGLHVMWEDLAEVRTLATDAGGPVGAWGVRCCRTCCPWRTNEVSAACSALTFEVDFFARNGFEALEGTPVEPEVYVQLLRSHDEGVAEFLDLGRLKPSTLGNACMLRRL